jgi:hypothetical protein
MKKKQKIKTERTVNAQAWVTLRVRSGHRSGSRKRSFGLSFYNHEFLISGFSLLLFH